MSEHECTRCGDEVKAKDAAGWYRETCWSCIVEIAGEKQTRREQCDDPGCLICNSS